MDLGQRDHVSKTASKPLEGESAQLAENIGPAYATVIAAEGKRDKANDYLVERTKALAELLMRAHALHPGIKKFEAFLARLCGFYAA